MSDIGAARGFDSIWAELRQLLDWQHGFGFYLVFANDQKAANLLRQRVESATRFRTRSLQWVRPVDLQTALDEVMSAALDATSDYNELQSPLWIELSAGADDPEWQSKRREILSALNRRRGALEQDCRRPLLLQLPLSMAPEIVTWAPDLWSIRQYIAVLPPLSALPFEGSLSAGNFQAGTEFADDIAAGPDIGGTDDDPGTGSLGDRIDQIDQISVELRRAARDVARRGDISAADGDLAGALAAFRDCLVLYRRLYDRVPDAPHPGLMRMLLLVGDGERDTGNVRVALKLYAEQVELARLETDKGTEFNQLHALSAGLDRLGRLQLELGQQEKATANLRASLDIREKIRDLEGDQLHTLRDLATAYRNLALTNRNAGAFGETLSLLQQALDLLQHASTVHPEDWSIRRNTAVTLGYLGDVQQALGNLKVASGLRQQCLEIFEELAQNEDATEPLIDLALARERMADLHYESGDIDNARRVYKESLQVRYKLRSTLGDTPLLLRSLAQCLGQCGNVEHSAGNSAQALAHYRESAALSRQLWHTSDDNPRTLRLFAVAKTRVASIEMFNGDPAMALLEFQECLPLFRRLQTQTGSNPQTLRDLLLIVRRIGRCKRYLGDAEGAIVCADEEVVLSRQLVEQTEGALRPQRDLCYSLSNARAAYMQVERIDEALAKQVEGVQLWRDLVAHSGATKDIRNLATELREMGDIFAERDDSKGAVVAYEECIKMLKDDLTNDPETPETMINFSTVLLKAAHEHFTNHNMQPALEHFDHAALLCRRIIDVGGEAQVAKFGLAIATMGRANIETHHGVFTAAIESLSEAAEALRSIAANDDANVLETLLDVLWDLRDLNLKLGREPEAAMLEDEHGNVAHRLLPRRDDEANESLDEHTPSAAGMVSDIHRD
jgi:tetratricopeptide (TPR) repeat protein